MSLLVISLPARERLGSRAGAEAQAAAARLPAEWPYVFSEDGRSAQASGQAAPALLPRAQQRVLLLAAADVAWHRIELPKAPPARLRAALAGVMEEALLDDAEALHLALAEGAAAGSSAWVASTDRARLAAALAVLEAGEAGGQSIDRVVATLEPVPAGAAPLGHFSAAGLEAGPEATGAEDPLPTLLLASAEGVVSLSLAGSLARSLVTAWAAAAPASFTATPAAAAAAERWLGAAVPVLPEAEWQLAAAQRGSDLRQFELVPRHRGTRALREAWRVLASPPWRPVRWGLAGLLVVQLVGLNAQAWQQRQQIAERKQQMETLLREAHPGVRAVLDAPLQMARETERLRASAGRAGPGDLEALLAAAAAAWPDGVAPAAALRFEPGRLTLNVPGWADAQWQQFQQRLRAGGHGAEFANSQVSVVAPR